MGVVSGPEKPKMAGNLFVVLNKSTNKAKQRRNSMSSETSEEDFYSCNSSPVVSRDSSPVRDNITENIRLKEELGSLGGFPSIITRGGLVKREIYGFPTEVITPKEREVFVRVVVRMKFLKWITF